jgi:hypothetical protein
VELFVKNDRHKGMSLAVHRLATLLELACVVKSGDATYATLEQIRAAAVEAGLVRPERGKDR